MSVPRLRFQKPLVSSGKRYVKGNLIIRFGGAAGGDGQGPGYYAITRDLEVYFVPNGRHEWHAEFVCKTQQDAEKSSDSYEDSRRRGRWLWTPVSKQRALAKLYKALRKDWELRCGSKEVQS